jgi:hypothetical protein
LPETVAQDTELLHYELAKDNIALSLWTIGDYSMACVGSELNLCLQIIASAG